MTAQIMDTVADDGTAYDLVGCAGTGLAHPRQFGMAPAMIHTGCYRGYVADYRVDQDRLLLENLTVGPLFVFLFFQQPWRPINGVKPRPGVGLAAGAAVYEGLAIPVAFTGRLLFATGFQPEHYVHMGFQKPSAYQRVLLLALTEGKITTREDRSAGYANRSGQFQQRYRANLWRGITDAFALDLDVDR